MDKIQLLYVENLITRKQDKVEQQLTFFVQIDNMGHSKEIDVVWSGEDNIWHTLAAKYSCMVGDDKEYWLASVTFILSETMSLLGNIEFGLRYRVSGLEFWDNNRGSNYFSQADSGVQLAGRNNIQNISFTEQWVNDQQIIPVRIAVDQSCKFEKVTIHWTQDNWETTYQKNCHTAKNIWDITHQSNARSPNQYGVQLWTGEISSDNPFNVQYVICCEGD